MAQIGCVFGFTNRGHRAILLPAKHELSMELSMKITVFAPWPVAIAGLLLATSLSGCGGVITFQGEKAFSMGGHPAPAPAPTPPADHAQVSNGKIVIDEKIQFEHDKAGILPVSFPILDAVAKVMKENPQVKKILIEGHASAEGDAAYNMKLSDDRAKSVMSYLEQHGVDKSRLSAKGFGTTQPLADNATEQGREKNRRVEFTIIDPPATGAAK